jgi:hypothetical protein
MIDGSSGELRPAQWLEPFDADGGECCGTSAATAGSLIVRRALGTGQVFSLGTFAGISYHEQRYGDFETFVRAVVGAGGGLPDLRTSQTDGEVLQWRLGRSGDARLLFVTNHGETEVVTFTSPTLIDGVAEVRELIGNGTYTVEPPGRFAVELGGGANYLFTWRDRAPS